MITCKASFLLLEAPFCNTKVNSNSLKVDIGRPSCYQCPKCVIRCHSSSVEDSHLTCTSRNHDFQGSYGSRKQKKKQLLKVEEKKGERKVNCEVEVISWRERRIKAQITIYAELQSV